MKIVQFAMSISTLPNGYFATEWDSKQNQRLLSIHPKHMLGLLNPIDFLILAVKLFAKFSYRLSSLTLRATANAALLKSDLCDLPNWTICGAKWLEAHHSAQARVFGWFLITFLARIQSRHDQIEKRISHCSNNNNNNSHKKQKPPTRAHNLYRRHGSCTANYSVAATHICDRWAYMSSKFSDFMIKNECAKNSRRSKNGKQFSYVTLWIIYSVAKCLRSVDNSKALFQFHNFMNGK